MPQYRWYQEAHAFTYDALYRLTSAIASGGLAPYNESYTYDATTGNLASKSGVNYTYDTNHPHAVASLSNGKTYQYEANGNQVTRNIGSDTFSLLYDAENHLVEVKKNGLTIATFTYDGDGKRVKSVIGNETTLFVGRHYEVINGSVTKYYFAGDQRIALRKNGTLYYLLSDHLGSTTITTDANGNKLSELKYRAWGEVRYSSGVTPTKYTYTGQYSNLYDFGLMFYGARWYDPSLLRFLSPDSIIPDPSNPVDLDRYAYARNNPSRYTDPMGHWTEDQLEEALGEDWREKYFGDDAVFHGREKLLKFLLSENISDLLSLELIKSLFNTAYGAFCVGADFSDTDALGARFSLSGSGVVFGSGTVDAILNLTSGEISVFGALEGGLVAGATATLVGGITFIKNLPTNAGYRGVTKNIGLMGGDTIGLNAEKFSGDTLNGGFVGAGGAVPVPNIGGYWSMSYAVEVLTVDCTGYEWFPYVPGPIEAVGCIRDAPMPQRDKISLCPNIAGL
jgi:RHS repeat-associated protein